MTTQPLYQPDTIYEGPAYTERPVYDLLGGRFRDRPPEKYAQQKHRGDRLVLLHAPVGAFERETDELAEVLIVGQVLVVIDEAIRQIIGDVPPAHALHLAVRDSHVYEADDLEIEILQCCG